MWPLSSSSGTVSVNPSWPCSRSTSVTGSSGARNSQYSVMPPSCLNGSSSGSAPRRSRITSSRPGTRNDVCRARVTSSSRTKVASLVKICRSGQNRTRVPVTPFATRLPLCSPDCGREGGLGPLAVEDAGRAPPERHALGGRRPVHLDVEPGGQRVDHRRADAVQAAGGDVGAAAELAAGVQLGEDHLDPGQPGLGLLVDRDAAAVVVTSAEPSGCRIDVDPRAVPGQRLVDGVVDDLPQAVHQPAGVGGPDVHARPLAHRLQALEDQQVLRRCRCCRWRASQQCPTAANLPARHGQELRRHARGDCLRGTG